MNAALSPTTQEIIDLFERHGHHAYGEGISKLSHSIQAGMIAHAWGYEDELVLAAFLHDIGHLAPLDFPPEKVSHMGDYGVDQHDLLGADYLSKKGFSAKIQATVRNHVAAKRYLCHKDPAYFEKLSEASKQTLAYQGGPMDAAEAVMFEQDSFFEASIRIRKTDEAAKMLDFEVLDEHWNKLISLLEKYRPNAS